MHAEDRFVVLKRCSLAGIGRLPFEVVDASSYRWLSMLIEQKTIERVPLSHEHITCGCGSHWMDVTAMERHACSDPVTSEAPGDEETAEVERTEREPVQLVPRNPGWYDVVVRGEKVNAKALRLAAAQKMIASLELMPEAEVQ